MEAETMSMKKGMAKKGLEMAAAVYLLSVSAACGTQHPQEEEHENISVSTAWDGAESGGDMSEMGDGYLEQQEQMPLNTDEQIEEAALSVGQILGERIYELRKPISGAADFCGEWKRTQIHTGIEGELVITDQTNERFLFEMVCYNYYNIGELDGEAWFVTPHLAIARFDDFGEEAQYVSFVRSEESLIVTATGAGFDLHLGNRVWVDGEYCKGNPVYTNAGQFEQYIDEELDAFMKNHLPEESYGYDFRQTAEIGIVTECAVVLSDGSCARLLRGEMPLNGYSFEILVTEDGRIYADVPAADFITNDDGAETMPEWEMADDRAE